MAEATQTTPLGGAWLLDVLHEVVHAHTGEGVACMFLSADEAEESTDLSCPAMTTELAGALSEHLERIQKRIDCLTRNRDAVRSYIARAHGPGSGS